MRFILQIATIIFLTAITSAYAETKQHSHGGRTHSHPLPKQGIKHRHGKGAYGIAISSGKQQVATRVVSNSIPGNLNRWHAVTDWKKFRKVLSGNTLILIPTNCPSSTSQSDCKVIWLLDKMGTSSKSGMRDDAKEINLISKSITNTEWGVCAGFDYYLCIGSLKARTITLPGKLSKYVFVNPNKKQFKVINKNGKDYIFDIVQGHPHQFVQLANSNNFKKYTANSTGLIQSLLLKAGKGMVNAMKESASIPTSHVPSETSTSLSTSNSTTPSKSKGSGSYRKSSSPSKPKVKKIYIGSHVGGTAQYVIVCRNGSSYSSINQKSNGFWYSYSSNMGTDYKGLSIEGVAKKKCN